MTSFPFLKVARDYGFDYGDVIRVVQAFGSGQMTPHERISFRKLILNGAAMDALHSAIRAEELRRDGLYSKETL